MALLATWILVASMAVYFKAMRMSYDLIEAAAIARRMKMADNRSRTQRIVDFVTGK